MIWIRTLITSAIALAAPISALTVAAIVADINVLTKQMTALQPIAEGLKVADATLFPIGQGKFIQILDELSEQAITIDDDVEEMRDSSPNENVTEATMVYEAYTEFVLAEEALLDVLIEKSGLASTDTDIGENYSAGLEDLRDALEPFVFSLMSQFPARGTELYRMHESLRLTFKTAIKMYSDPRKKRSLRFANRGIAGEV